MKSLESWIFVETLRNHLKVFKMEISRLLSEVFLRETVFYEFLVQRGDSQVGNSELMKGFNKLSEGMTVLLSATSVVESAEFSRVG